MIEQKDDDGLTSFPLRRFSYICPSYEASAVRLRYDRLQLTTKEGHNSNTALEPSLVRE